ncbi:AroM family protein [Blautia pseudococcoides]|uniref:AroM family protein n=1 Tax=Blautia pseudococcoides TaxID=1796616 RepID=UPI00148B0485|nr:AroM family protein [Blautia pseudococcoides]QJU16834.1 AroM family protein [Blautia pseudococcoides]
MKKSDTNQTPASRTQIKIGAVTIGQSPRTDITGDICPLLAPNITLEEYGALDPFDKDYINQNLAPGPDSSVLVTRMRDASQVIIGEEHILPLVQSCITRAEAGGCQATVLLCTGKFPKLRHERMLIIPQPLIHSLLQKLADDRPIGLLVPDESQIPQAQSWFSESDIQVQVQALSPYLKSSLLQEKAHSLQKENLSLILPDCMGYSIALKKELEHHLPIPILLPRTFIATLLNELFGS